MATLSPVTPADLGFVFECLKELRGTANYDRNAFDTYIHENGLLHDAAFRLFVGRSGITRVGMLTCNRFAIPRYLGFGYELEEVIVHPEHQHQGHGGALVKAFLEFVAIDNSIRKVIVKTDDEIRAGRVYQKYFDVVPTKVYGKSVHLL